MKRNLLIFAAVLCLLFAFGTAFAQDKPSIKLNWYGYVKLDGSYDQNMTSHGNFAMWVNRPTVDESDEQFNMTANQTRFGVKMQGENYKNVGVAGQIEFDLYAGVTGATVAENKPMLQLRHAYFSVKYGPTMLLAGQTWDLFSPLNPSTLNYAVLWGCGNLGYRRPQISLWQTFNPAGPTTFTMAGGFLRTIGTDLTPTFTLAVGETSEGADDGTDAGIPSFQGIVDFTHKFSSGSSLRCGVSGLYGTLKAETTLGNSEDYESWAVNGHLMLSFASGFGIAGEAFRGSNLQSYMGGINNNSTINGVRSTGAWASCWAALSPKTKVNIGAGIDDPQNQDFSTGRSKNFSYFGNISYAFIPQASVGLELSQWETEYKIAADDTDTFHNTRVQTSFMLNF